MSDTQAPAEVIGWTLADVIRFQRILADTGNVSGVTFDDGKGVRYYSIPEALALYDRMVAHVRAETAAVTPPVLDPLRRPVRRFVGYMRPGY